jgi:hypothetical protein
VTIRFSDGVAFDLTGPYRIEWRHDGCYVVGGNSLIPVDSEEEGQRIIAELIRPTKP